MSQAEFEQTFGLNNLLHHYEFLAQENEWRCERVSDELLILVIEGHWRIYTISLKINYQAKAIQLTCSFDLNFQTNRERKLYQLINLINQRNPNGFFFVSEEYNQGVLRNQIPLIALPQIQQQTLSQFLQDSVFLCDCYFPSMQMVNYGEDDFEIALEMAIGEVAGNA